MNNARRKELKNLIGQLGRIQDEGDLYACINDLEDIKYEEECSYDNIPENLQSSQRASESEEAIDNLEDALNLLNEVYDMDEIDLDSELIQEAIDKIESACW